MNSEKKFSIFFGGITKITPDSEISIHDMINQISSVSLKPMCDKIRQIQDNDLKIRKQKRNKLKKYLTYVTPAGTFSKRNKSGLISMSGLAPIDIDYIDDINKLKASLVNDPYIHIMFISPSGEGLKIFIKVPQKISDYPPIIKTFYDYLNKKYDIDTHSLDSATHDIARACFLSYDPNIYYNEKAVIFSDIDENISKKIKTRDTSRSGKEYREIIKLLFSKRSKEYIYKYMNDYSKWKDSPDQYKDYTYEKAKIYVNESLKLSADEKKSIIPEIAKKCLEDNKIVSIRTDKFTEIWIYRDGIFVPNGKTYIEEYVSNILKDFYDSIVVSKIIDFIKKETYQNAEDFFKEENEKYICINNGVLNIFERKLYDFSDKYRFFNKLPVNFDKTKTCDETLKHFDTVLEKSDINLMQELYGYLLYRNYNIQKAFLFAGDGGNGKGKTIEQMKALLGKDNIINISLQTFEQEPFMRGEVHKKLANLGADLGKTTLTDTSTFRALTGEDIITANRKYLDSVSFKNYAKMIFAVNNLPTITDNSDGFWRRWINIDFNITFLPQNIYEKKKKTDSLEKFHRCADITISDRLTLSDELSGVLNWALVGFDRLMKNKDFSYYKSLEETKKVMQKRESSAVMFVQDSIEPIKDVDQYVVHEDLYKAYLGYCIDSIKPISPESDLKFRKILEAQGLSLHRKNTANGWELRWYFIKLKNDGNKNVFKQMEET